MDEATKQPVTRNPYAPPAAPVADAAHADGRGGRPRQVTWAVGILWSYLAVDVVDAALHLQPPLGSAFREGALGGVFLVILSGEAWVIYHVSFGRRWALALALAWWILGLCLDLLPIQRLSGLPRVLEGLENLLMAVAMSLLFLTPGRRWFRQTLA